jgi:signal transduction histidine kinase
VSRLALRGRTVVRKEAIGPDGGFRLRHERAILQRLRGLAGVAQLADAPEDPESIVMEDAGPATLAARAAPPEVDELWRLALLLARAVAGVHDRGVMHRDLSPAHVVISRSGEPCLVGFSLASSVAEIRPEFAHPSQILGTLPYVAPEQTGRTARPVDQRADLYALGAVLYELATGGPPFGSGDPLRLTHDHLAREPVAPDEVRRAVPRAMSQIIMHLLQKEPDDRYQSAAGLVHDLERARDAEAGPTTAGAFRVGEHDVPVRLTPPSRLVGREVEVTALREAFGRAVAGRCRGLLVAGAPGIGKTALINELRPVVTEQDGWFAAGKFDQYQRDLEFDGVYQAFRALGRLLLAEPEDALAGVRERILAALGPGAASLASVNPEFATLLGIAPDPGDPLTAQVRAQQGSAAVLRAVASPDRPLVFFVDDLQWAGRTPLGLFDIMLAEEPVEGLLLVGAYRERDVDPAHLLGAHVSRWRAEPLVEHVRLEGLEVPSLVTMVSEMLAVAPERAAHLVAAIAPHTSGNPYEVVELLDALRRDGLLTATAGAWRWDTAVVRRRVGGPVAGSLTAARVEALPPASRATVEAIACLGGRVELGVVGAATGRPAGDVERQLAPALDQGMMVVEPGAREAVRFRHDRIREAILERLGPERRRAVHLALARRLSAVPELPEIAAEQYLQVGDGLEEPAERRRVVVLLRAAAAQAALIGDDARKEQLLRAALALVDADDVAARAALHTQRHAALYGLGRLEEADDEYRAIERLVGTALERVQATAVQVHGLSHRNLIEDAVGLAFGSLRELGLEVPSADRIRAELDRRFGALHRWLDAGDDAARAELTDPALLAAAHLVNAVLPALYMSADLPTVAWLGLEAVQIWGDRGPARSLIGPASHAAFAAVALRSDYDAAYRAHRRILAFGEARGYEPETSQARFVFSLQGPWFEPVEASIGQARQARKGLIAGGDLANAGFSYHATVEGLLDCAPALEGCLAEIEAALDFRRRVASDQSGQWLENYQWLMRTLLGRTNEDGSGPAFVERYGNAPDALFHAFVTRAIAAAILDDEDGLGRHTEAAMELVPAFEGVYPTTWAYVLRGLAVAARLPALRDEARNAALVELDQVMRWTAQRAAGAPENFLHLLRLLEAERAWAIGDHRAAALAFDAGRHEVSSRSRPWHRALITERTARFHLARGLHHGGHELLAQARQQYLTWGATAKVDQLDWAYPALRTQHAPADGPRADPVDLGSAVTKGTIDLMGIVSASRALSSETDLDRLHERVVSVLGEMTGATGVRLVPWSEEDQDWLAPAPGRHRDEGSQEGPLPSSVLRYVRRTREPLVVDDATRDDRFARDPYFARLPACSVLAVPIVTGGALRAVLLLENRLIRGSFAGGRLDTVKLIAGQLAVSLDNARVYARYRRIGEEQAALRRVATLVAQGASPTAVLDAVAAELERLLEADALVLARYEVDQEITVVAHHAGTGPQLSPGTRVVPPDGSSLVETLHLRAIAEAPIVVDGRPWGVAIAEWRRDGPPPADAGERMAEFVGLLETAIANAHGRDQLAASRARLLTAADAARRRVVRDLHDGAQQRLVQTVITLGLAQWAMRQGGEEAEALVAEAVEHAKQANAELRELAHGILPADLTAGGLRGAVDSMVERLGLPVTVDIAADRFPEEVEVNAYFITAEALTNVIKHAGASRAAVTARIDDGLLHLEVRDDGVGGADPGGRGIVGIDDRVTALGGRLTLRSPPGAGTVVAVTLPVSGGQARSS